MDYPASQTCEDDSVSKEYLKTRAYFLAFLSFLLEQAKGDFLTVFILIQYYLAL